MLLGECFDRFSFVRQPLGQRLLLGPPCFRKPEFTGDHAGAIDDGPDFVHFANVMWESRHNLFQDTVGGCRTHLVLEKHQREIDLLVAARFDGLVERSCELWRACGKRSAEQASSSKGEFRPVLSEPRLALADCEGKIFRQHRFQIEL